MHRGGGLPLSRAGPSLIALVLLSAVAARAESGRVNLHLELAPAFLLSSPHRDYFHPGFEGSLKGDVRI